MGRSDHEDEDRPNALTARASAFMTRWRPELACAALLVFMGANLLSAVSRKSIANDELYHIPAGYYHLSEGFFRIGSEHPPLAKMWAALPLLAMDVSAPPPFLPGEPYADMTWRLTSGFWLENRERFLAICAVTRLLMVLLTLALGGLVFAHARRLLGPRAALFAVALFCVEPTLLAHGRVVGTDVPAAFAYLLAFYALGAYARARTWPRALLVGVAAGAALVTKLSMIVVVPVLGAAALVALAFAPRLGERRATLALHAALAVAAALVALNAAYGFRDEPLVVSDLEWLAPKSPEDVAATTTALRAAAAVLPTDFLVGLHNIIAFDRAGTPASLLGQHARHGWWYYFPVAFALKTSIPFLLAALAGVVWGAWLLVARRDYRFLLLVVPPVLYTALAMQSHVNIGIRHLLPAFPFLAILGGALLDRVARVERRRGLAIATVALTLGLAAAEAIRAFPDYVPYMNQLASRRPHWWYLSDSNVEWGDDVQELARYLHARGERSISGALSGGWTLTFYGVDYRDLYPRSGAAPPETRYVAVGASFLNGSTVDLPPREDGTLPTERERVEFFAGFRDQQPEAVIGKSIYLYRVR
jgi:4-amino-4-deoxy-L-arabinose transferase-like glycosyltransferase